VTAARGEIFDEAAVRAATLGAVALVLTLSSVQRAGAQEAKPGGKAEAVPVQIRIAKALGSASATTGQTFEGTVAADAVLRGTTVYAAGTPVKGKVVYAKPDGKMRAPGILRLELTSIGAQKVQTNPVAWVGDSPTPSRTTGTGGASGPSPKGDAALAAGSIVTFNATSPGGYRYVPRHGR
jgi:hypothetical protein